MKKYKSLMQSFFTLILSIVLLAGTNALAQDIREVRVQFPRGETGTTVEGSISGYEIVD